MAFNAADQFGKLRALDARLKDHHAAVVHVCRRADGEAQQLRSPGRHIADADRIPDLARKSPPVVVDENPGVSSGLMGLEML